MCLIGQYYTFLNKLLFFINHTSSTKKSISEYFENNFRQTLKGTNKKEPKKLIESLTPSNFSRAYFKGTNGDNLTEKGNQSNQSTSNIFDIFEDQSVFRFSMPTPRNHLIENDALKARNRSSDILKRIYAYINDH